MASVLAVESVNEDIFLCGTCKLAFTSLQLFLEHKREPCCPLTYISAEFIVEPAKSSFETVEASVHSAEYCGIVDNSVYSYQEQAYPTQSQIIVPEQDTFEPNPNEDPDFKCMTCNKTFKKSKSLLLHLKTHSGEKPFQCPICGRCFLQNTHLQRHMLSHKVWPRSLCDSTPKFTSVDTLDYACSFCDLTFHTYSQYRLHLKTHYSIKQFKCIQNNCLQVFDNLDLLLHHVSEIHSHVSYSCHICSLTFQSLKDISIHSQNHHTLLKETKVRKKFCCMHCDAVFTNSERLSLHLATENHSKACSLCDKTFASDKRLRSHLLTHGQQKSFHCNVCGANFNLKKYLETHMLKHGDRQFLCSLCKYKFKRKDLLNRHMKTHQARKQFQCPFKDKLGCKLQFSRSDKLKLHVKAHTNRIAFSGKCKRKTRRKSTTNRETAQDPIDSTGKSCNQ